MPSWFKGLGSGARIGLIAILLLLVFGGGYLALANHKGPKSSTTVDPQVAGNSNNQSDSPSTSPTASGSTSPTPSGSGTPKPAGATGTPTPTLPPAAYADNFSGHWYLNFGDMTLTQSGTHVTGSYYNGPSAATGSIDGNVNGQTLTATWSINGNHGPMSLVKGTHTLSGTYSSTYKWCGALSGYQFPAGCGFAGHWVTNLLASGSNCAMDLVRTNNSVTGSYCNGTVSGTISYPVNATKLAGTWKINGTTGPINFFLAGLGASSNQLFFQGNYNTGSQTNNYWCGGTTAANQPSTCLKT